MPSNGTLGALTPLTALLLITACASDDAPPPAEPPVAEAQPAPAEAAPDPAPDVPPVTAERTGDGLGLSEDELVEVFAQNRLDPEAFEAMQLGDGRRVFAASYPASTERQVLWVAMFGGQEPHTVRVDYFPVNAQGGENQAVGEALADLLTALFPDWSQAAVWPQQAGAQAWQEAIKEAEAGQGRGEGGARVPILEGERDGVYLAALGIPPNVVSYVFTTSEPCRPSVAAATFYKGYVGCG